MNLLEEGRTEINQVDREMAQLFEKRMKAVEKVIAYKIQNDMPIFDAGREEEVVEKNCKLIQDENLKALYKEYILFQMKLSKDYQQQILCRSTSVRLKSDNII